MRRRTTGITRRSSASRRKVSSAGQVAPKVRSGARSWAASGTRALSLDRAEIAGIEAGAVPGVARGAHLVDPDQERVTVAVERHGAHHLDVTGGVALAPVVPAAPRPVGDPALGQG